MNLNETLVDVYEDFQGDIRKLEELISQMALWADECTINHKKEEIRLPQYIELHLNLEMLKQQLQEKILTLGKEEELKEKIQEAQHTIEEQLERYKAIERIIHQWIKEIKNIYILMNQSRVLEENKDYLLGILDVQS